MRTERTLSTFKFSFSLGTTFGRNSPGYESKDATYSLGELEVKLSIHGAKKASWTQSKLASDQSKPGISIPGGAYRQYYKEC